VIVEHVADRAPHFGGGTELAREKVIREDFSLAPRGAIDGTRHPDGEALHAAREGALVLRLDDEVQVIALHRVVHQPDDEAQVEASHSSSVDCVPGSTSCAPCREEPVALGARHATVVDPASCARGG
jgi:hypothetical protein